MNKQLQYTLLPADKSYILGNDDGTATLHKELVTSDGIGSPLEIYVLSDDETKEGEYGIPECVNESFNGKVIKYIKKDEKMKDCIIVSDGKKEYLTTKHLFNKAKKIIATTNPELWHECTQLPNKDYPNGLFKQVTGKVFQSDIEYIISLYNGEGKEVYKDYFDEAELYIKNSDLPVIKDLKKDYQYHGIKQLLAHFHKDMLNETIKDNADKKFTKNDIASFISEFIITEHGLSINDWVEEKIESLTKEQPKSDTVMVEYEYIDGFQPSVTRYPEIQPKLKDGNIIIVKQ